MIKRGFWKSSGALLLLILMIEPSHASEFREVSFETDDGGTILGNLYGEGSHAIVLAHGRAFNKESWQEQALEMKNQGLQVLAIDFRGYGKSKPGKKAKALELDVLAAIDYLKGEGAERVSLLGASMGGGAVGRAVVKAKADAVGRVVLLAAAPPVDNPKKLKGNKLFVVSEGDYFAKSTREQFEKAPGSNRLEILPGDAHAQHIFKTNQGDVITKLILDFLTE